MSPVVGAVFGVGLVLGFIAGMVFEMRWSRAAKSEQELRLLAAIRGHLNDKRLPPAAIYEPKGKPRRC